MKFRVGRFTCEVLLGEDGKMRVKWLPGPPKYLNKQNVTNTKPALLNSWKNLNGSWVLARKSAATFLV